MEINVYAVLMPLLLGLIAVEFIYCQLRKPGYYNFQDSMANLATAIGNQVVNVGTGALIYRGYDWLQVHCAPWTIANSWASTAFLFLAVDFLFYWFHRAGHTVHVLWAAHSPHHSSEELNYTVAARASVTQRAASFIFYAPLALLGFPAERLLAVVLVHHVFQFWPHTRAIEKMPDWFEKYFNAPTHHRVHHGANDIYLDKNYGGVLIIWDKLFGSFEPESEPVIYGIRPPLGTWEVLDTNFYYYKHLWKLAKAAPYWTDKLKLWFMPLDWLPRGIAYKPHGYDPKKQVKYATEISGAVETYLLSQFAPLLALMMLVARDDSPLSGGGKLLLGGLVWLGVLAWGGLLESAEWAGALETARLLGTPLALAACGWSSLAASAAAVSLLSAALLLPVVARSGPSARVRARAERPAEPVTA